MTELVEQHFFQINFEGQIWAKNSESTEYNLMTGQIEGLNPYHINFFTFRKLFQLMRNLNKKELTIVETGTSAVGVDSTTLFDKYIRKYGGELYTVDINPQTSLLNKHKWCNKTKPIISDSVEFLEKFDKEIDVLYLDSMDIDWLNPMESMQHGLMELYKALPKMSKKSLILIDDTPKNSEWLPFRNETYYKLKDKVTPGKGYYANELLNNLEKNNQAKLELHQYQLLYSINK
jgi:hypothetical protein